MAPLYEQDNAYRHGRALLIGFLVLVPLFCFLPRWLYSYAWPRHFILEDLNRDKATRIVQQVEQFPKPRLQYRPREDLQDYRSQQIKELTSYGWIDKNQGTVRIPIDEAMDRYLKTAPQP
ncbi:MAG TPA: hypothetical protein VFO10_22930 [Oligoflexus sp.]|uniref:hypothetical protein n=1 Tax=Oligoflexus sp. TaxID=1971216 RepID=UPI002D80BEC0|nr:hypothetical protein [Oligoflexus sp.]HET9240136.1 hypothetical protein [Oligoflexus sp.]